MFRISGFLLSVASLYGAMGGASDVWAPPPGGGEGAAAAAAAAPDVVREREAAIAARAKVDALSADTTRDDFKSAVFGELIAWVDYLETAGVSASDIAAQLKERTDVLNDKALTLQGNPDAPELFFGRRGWLPAVTSVGDSGVLIVQDPRRGSSVVRLEKEGPDVGVQMHNLRQNPANQGK